MMKPETIPHEHSPDPHHNLYSRTTFGFWLYLLTDFVLFGTLFATYAVLRHSTFGGPSVKELFELSFTLTPALVLLISSLTVGLAAAMAHRKDKKWTIGLFGVTFLLGIIFVVMELDDMARLVHGGNGWQRSAFLSAYFTLVGTHAVHMIFALIWVIVLVLPVWMEGITAVHLRRLTCLKMFWQFLNIIWVFIYSFVYLLGVV
jgi:cytochrome o ubiquinol oxidase subunit III